MSDGNLRGIANILFDGYSAYEIRKEYGPDQQDIWLNDLRKNKSIEVAKSEIQNFRDDISKPLRLKQEVALKEHVMVAGDHLYITPFPDAFFTDNPLTETNERLFPIDLVPAMDTRCIATFIIPDDYEVESLPKNQIYSLQQKGAKYSFSATVTGNKITTVGNLIFIETLYPPEAYTQLREFYGLIIAKQSEQIVLRKKKN